MFPIQDDPPVLKPKRPLAKRKLLNRLVCNARSLNNKADALEVIARQKNASIIIISKCWDTFDKLARIKGYASYFNTRCHRGLNRRGGGVTIFFCNDLPSKVSSEPIDSDFSPDFVIAGDFNETNRQWFSNILDLRQAVTIPTHQSGSTLDFIFTNLTDFYYAPRSLGPLLYFRDHFIIFWKASLAISKPKRVKYTVRPLTEDSISTFGH